VIGWQAVQKAGNGSFLNVREKPHFNTNQLIQSAASVLVICCFVSNDKRKPFENSYRDLIDPFNGVVSIVASSRSQCYKTISGLKIHAF
jgi:hypothetical protein